MKGKILKSYLWNLSISYGSGLLLLLGWNQRMIYLSELDNVIVWGSLLTFMINIILIISNSNCDIGMKYAKLKFETSSKTRMLFSCFMLLSFCIMPSMYFYTPFPINAIYLVIFFTIPFSTLSKHNTLIWYALAGLNEYRLTEAKK